MSDHEATPTTPENDPEASLKQTRNRTRTPGRGRHPFLAGRPSGVWYPDAIGVVPGYPKTQAGYDAKRAVLRANRQQAAAQGLLNRHGVPDGWAGRRQEVGEAYAKAAAAGKALTSLMIAEKAWAPDCREARIAMEAAMTIALSPTCLTTDRLNAVRLILTYTQPAPTIGQIMAGNPLGWLEGLARVAQAKQAASVGCVGTDAQSSAGNDEV